MTALHFVFENEDSILVRAWREVLGARNAVFHFDLMSFGNAVSSGECKIVFIDSRVMPSVVDILNSNILRCYVISEKMDQDTLRKTLGTNGVCGVINGVNPDLGTQWKRLCELAVFEDEEDFDICRLIGSDSHQSFLLEKSSERISIMDAIERGIVERCTAFGDDVAKIFSERAIALADELMLNAIFDANPSMKGVDRSQSYDLVGQSAVRLDFAVAPSAFVIAVTDRYGSLEKADIVKHICNPAMLGKVSERVSGGLGLRLSVEGASALLFEVSKGRKTRVVLLTHMVPSQRQFRANPKSICIFSRG
jgi:hypothetical protein